MNSQRGRKRSDWSEKVGLRKEKIDWRRKVEIATKSQIAMKS
jgi:hypothetical protein